MNRIIDFILSESLADEAETLADKLVKAFGVKRREITNLYKDSDRNYEKFYKLLKKLEDKVSGDLTSKSKQPGEDIPLMGHQEIDNNMESEGPKEHLKDQSIIDVLKYLVHYFRSRDRVRVLAARFGLDPDIYAAAGLGNIPQDYNDEDIWNTMDQSGQGNVPFYKSAWQPYYIESLDKINDLPKEIKQEIADIVQQGNETKDNVSYPVRSDDQYNDIGIAYEAKLLNNIDINGLIIEKGSIIKYLL